MASSKELMNKRSEYYAFKEKVNMLKYELKSSLDAIAAANAKANESYTYNGELLDGNKLKKMQNIIENQYNIISTRTIPAIDYQISKLSNDIENAIAAEIAEANVKI